jgi:hypothetical protein
MEMFKLYFFVFRFHNVGNPIFYDSCILSVKDAREYYNDLCNQYDYVFMFKQFD